MEAAATKIQTAFKGFKSRKQQPWTFLKTNQKSRSVGHKYLSHWPFLGTTLDTQGKRGLLMFPTIVPLCQWLYRDHIAMFFSIYFTSYWWLTTQFHLLGALSRDFLSNHNPLIAPRCNIRLRRHFFRIIHQPLKVVIICEKNLSFEKKILHEKKLSRDESYIEKWK